MGRFFKFIKFIVFLKYVYYNDEIKAKIVRKKVSLMVEIEKKKITLSIPVETNGKLEELAQKYGMTKSGLVNFLVNQVAEAGTIYRQ